MIGDFTWTGWDYLGEAGIGRIAVRRRTRPTGAVRGALPVAARVRAATSTSPATAGPRPTTGRSCSGCAPTRTSRSAAGAVTAAELSATPWAWSDTVGSWSLAGAEGKPVTVEVYSDADEVELLLDGRSLGTAKAGEANRYRA